MEGLLSTGPTPSSLLNVPEYEHLRFDQKNVLAQNCQVHEFFVNIDSLKETWVLPQIVCETP